MTHKFSSTDPNLFAKILDLGCRWDDVFPAVSALNAPGSMLRMFALPSFLNPLGDHIIIQR